MKKKEVPQDESGLNKVNSKELCYAVDDEGNYTTALSSGWNPKKIALDNALEDIDIRVEEARLRVLSGSSSPIEYYMELSKMDPAILAGYVGFYKWSVKRHFKPRVFQKLSTKKLKKYAEVFDISLEELQNVPK